MQLRYSLWCRIGLDDSGFWQPRATFHLFDDARRAAVASFVQGYQVRIRDAECPPCVNDADQSPFGSVVWRDES